MQWARSQTFFAVTGTRQLECLLVAELQFHSLLQPGDADPGPGQVEQRQTGDIAGLQTGGIQFGGGDRFRADAALGEAVAGAPEIFSGQGVQAEEALPLGE